jgi:hypothetical protein
MLILVATRFKAWVCGRLLAAIANSNPAGGLGVCFMWVLCVVKYRSLCRADPSSRRVLQYVECPVNMIARSRKGRPWSRIGSKLLRGKKNYLTPLILDSTFILQHYVDLKLQAVLCVVGWEVKQEWISYNFEGSEVRLSLNWYSDIYPERICKVSERHPGYVSLNCCSSSAIFCSIFLSFGIRVCYLFILYLVVLSVAQIVWDLAVGWSMNNNCKACERRPPCYNCSHHSN